MRFQKTMRSRSGLRWNDDIVKDIEITSENCHTIYGVIHINVPKFIDTISFANKEEAKNAVITAEKSIEFRITYNGNVVIPLEQNTSNKTLISLFTFLKSYIYDRMSYLIEYKQKKKEKRLYSRYGMSDDLIEAVTTLVTTTNFSQIEPAMRVLVKNFLDHPSTWSFDGHIPIYYQNSCFNLLVDYGTAYWFHIVSEALDPYEKVKRIEKDIFSVKEEPKLREKALNVLNDKVVYIDYPKAEEIKGAIKKTSEETFRELCIELLAMLLSVILDVFNGYELISLKAQV